jgi:hypothetical protein
VSGGRDVEPQAAGERVQVWRGADRLWRYRYVEPGTSTVIESNRSFVAREEAVDSARLAYPGLPIVELAHPPEGEPARRSWKRAVGKLVWIGLIATVARVLIRWILRMRRSAKKVRKAMTLAGVVASLARRDRPPGDGEEPPR